MMNTNMFMYRQESEIINLVWSLYLRLWSKIRCLVVINGLKLNIITFVFKLLIKIGINCKNIFLLFEARIYVNQIYRVLNHTSKNRNSGYKSSKIGIWKKRIGDIHINSLLHVDSTQQPNLFRCACLLNKTSAKRNFYEVF